MTESRLQGDVGRYPSVAYPTLECVRVRKASRVSSISAQTRRMWTANVDTQLYTDLAVCLVDFGSMHSWVVEGSTPHDLPYPDGSVAARLWGSAARRYPYRASTAFRQSDLERAPLEAMRFCGLRRSAVGLRLCGGGHALPGMLAARSAHGARRSRLDGARLWLPSPTA